MPTTVIDGIELDRLPMWVVYDHPLDSPEHYIARLHYSLPAPEPTGLFLRSASLEEIRSFMADNGFARMERSPGDDPVIIEVWLV